MPGMLYAARAGGPWLCRVLVRAGFQAVVVPSGFRVRVQPQRWMTTWWWNQHYADLRVIPCWTGFPGVPAGCEVGFVVVKSA
jgi:hypothetical protein